MEFTAEQQAHIDSLVQQSKEGLFGEDELTKRVTSEVDRRVESGIQKGLETQKSKWEKELTDKATLTAEELANKDLEEKLKELQSREMDIMKRSNSLEAKDMLSIAGIPKAHYEKFINLLVSDNDETTKSNVGNFIDTFNETKVQIEADIKKQLSNVPQPRTGSGETPLNKESFNKLGYSEKAELKQTNPELFNKFMGK